MSAPSPGHPAGGPMILVVDDDQDLREALRDVLEDEGYRVALAGDGEVALEMLRGGLAPALILLDWMMPRCDGLTFRQAQRSDPALAEIPVVLLTADASLQEKMTALAIDASLQKPVEIETLLATVRRFLP